MKYNWVILGFGIIAVYAISKGGGVFYGIENMLAFIGGHPIADVVIFGGSYGIQKLYNKYKGDKI